ncbi:hypothetical protein M8542_14520 [Amycolatopsis sp. OK19-0408]|uniref:VWFA domain-containing protein n=1 Tax=Amycolatopsis iheyensis TaxID=2945988 RepID=A0A9X2NG72_9PSEU|nr:hypothetical protein [Amycolatopsis iheyensis]MCR6484035.1 hypothetical protein [Amycolatopsis iheyensis]
MILPSHLLPSTPRRGRFLGAPPDQLASQKEFDLDDAPYELGDPGQPSPTPTIVIALFDDSGSVTGRGGNDPLARRYDEVEHAFQVVARRGSRRELGAVLHFDSPCRTDAGPVPITRLGMASLRPGLRRPKDGVGSSTLAPSLDQAVELAHSHPRHQATLVVLSDFLLLDADPAQVLSDLRAFPGLVHAVVLGSRVPDGVLDGAVTVTQIMSGGPRGAVAKALFGSLVARRPGSTPLLPN